MNIIHTLHLGHRFERRDEEGRVTASQDALKDVSIDIEAGSFVALIGRNGSGKSTMARHLNALLKPTSGTVLVEGKDTADSANELFVREHAGMVFQNPDNQIIADVVEEDVAFGPENLGVPTEEIWTRVAEALESVGLSEYRQVSPNRLSGGQKQRVAIAGLVAMRPSCMILDEATAMLDPSGRKSVMDVVRKLNREEGVTMILITHYMEEAAMADRVIVMEKGQVAMDGSPREVFSRREKLDKLGLDVPPITQLADRLADAGMNIPRGILTREELTQAICNALAADAGNGGCR